MPTDLLAITLLGIVVTRAVSRTPYSEWFATEERYVGGWAVAMIFALMGVYYFVVRRYV